MVGDDGGDAVSDCECENENVLIGTSSGSFSDPVEDTPDAVVNITSENGTPTTVSNGVFRQKVASITWFSLMVRTLVLKSTASSNLGNCSTRTGLPSITLMGTLALVST